jgi:site-specific recombinase XerD
VSNRPLIDPLTDNLAGLTEAEGSDAMRRFEAIRPHVLQGVSLTELARWHGYGVHATVQGVPLHMLQRWLGHVQLSTTAIYAYAVGKEEQHIAARMWGQVTPFQGRDGII